MRLRLFASLLSISLSTLGCLPPQAPPTPPAADTRPAAAPDAAQKPPEQPADFPAGWPAAKPEDLILEAGKPLEVGGLRVSLDSVEYATKAPTAPVLTISFTNLSETKRLPTPTWRDSSGGLHMADDLGNVYSGSGRTVGEAGKATWLYPRESFKLAVAFEPLVARAKRLEAAGTLYRGGERDILRVRFAR